MAKNKNQKPFNLLYKFEAQKTGIDKLYDFVTVQGRYIVVSVMFLIILAFVYRFPLDKKLNDEINRSKINLSELDYYSGKYENSYREVISRTASAKNFIDIYPEELDPTNVVPGQIKLSDILKRIREIREKSFNDDIIIIDYSYSAAPDTDGSIKLTGSSSTFTKAEEFRQALRLEKNIVSDVFINNLGSTKDGAPKFGLDIKTK